MTGSWSRRRPEWFELALVVAVIVGLPLVIFAGRALDTARADARVIEMVARLPTSEQGGWTPETIEVLAGERVRLRLTSRDVVHGFAIPKLGVDAGWVEPGKVKEVEFVADTPGRYTFLCTAWCTNGHWRMRGYLNVVDPAAPEAWLMDVDPPRTDWVATGIDLDVEHPGEHVPPARPNARSGAALWSSISPAPITRSLSVADLRLLSPSDAFERLSRGLPGAPETARLTAEERWDLVAHLWLSRTTPAELAAGGSSFERDCTGCHGAEGRGDGPGANMMAEFDLGPEDMAKSAVDFTDLEAQAGATDMHYYGKLVRGGMGTSMPNWGQIHTEEGLWALVTHLRSLAFEYPATPTPTP